MPATPPPTGGGTAGGGTAGGGTAGAIVVVASRGGRVGGDAGATAGATDDGRIRSGRARAATTGTTTGAGWQMMKRRFLLSL